MREAMAQEDAMAAALAVRATRAIAGDNQEQDAGKEGSKRLEAIRKFEIRPGRHAQYCCYICTNPSVFSI